MNRKTFIRELTKELQKQNISDISEIINDFNEHFDFKLEEGKLEEEISKRIGNPVDIANDYSKHSKKEPKSNTMMKIALGFVSFFSIMLYIVLVLSVLAIGLLTISLAILGVSLTIGVELLGLIPSMPYIVGLLLGISILGLAVVSAIATINLFLYVRQWAKAYIRWSKNVLNDNIYPTLSLHPIISKRKSSIFKLLNIIGIIVFVVIFIIGYITAATSAGSFEFWHVWNWFQ